VNLQLSLILKINESCRFTQRRKEKSKDRKEDFESGKTKTMKFDYYAVVFLLFPVYKTCFGFGIS